MIYTIPFLIEKRKEKWEKTHSIELDLELRNAIVDELIQNEVLLDELVKQPEQLIELLFIVVNKEQKTMPFFLNEVQRAFIEILNKAIKDYEAGEITDISILVLKGRQQGFTTLITAIQLSYDLLRRNFQGFTLADKAENTETIFQNKAKFPYNALPDPIKPTEKFNNKRQLLFEKLNSSWAVDTATEQVGRSKTINFFHGSECAFWKCGIAPVQAGLGEAFTKNCIKIYESTANGFNDYQKMWASGQHINCFFEWWRTHEYRIKFESDQIHKDFLSFIYQKNDWINQRLRWLKDVKKLDDEQLYWYYKKYEKYIDKDTIKQEYPCTPQEAFLLSGKTVFDTEILIHRLSQIPKPLKVGYFIYDYDDTLPSRGATDPITGKPYSKCKISNIRWVNSRNGYIKIYYKPNSPRITKYTIGGDTAGDGSDNFTGHALDARSGMQVAVLEKKFDAAEYARQMYCLGAYFKWALLCIEGNFDSFINRELARLGYPNLYVSTKIDTYTNKPEKKYGFLTTKTTRPIIISYLIELVKTHPELINDENTINELLTIIRNEKGRIEAPEGGHDDHMMGLAIAHESIHQVSFTDEQIKLYPEFNFSVEAEFQNSDKGEHTIVI